MKTCSKCKIEKEIFEFYKDKSKKDGVCSSCKICILKINNWEKQNPEKAKAAKKSWKIKNSKKNLEYNKNWASLNPIKVKASRSKWDNANKERIKIKDKIWKLKNINRTRESHKEWRSKNPGIVSAIHARRRSAKLNATPAWVDHVQIQMFYDLSAALNAMGEQKWHVDHIVPLQSTLVCGLHCEANLCVVTATENISKSNRYWPDMPL